VIAFWSEVASSVVASVAVGLVLRLTRRRTRLSGDTASTARDALTKCEWLFGQVAATSGRLRHPWSYPAGDLHSQLLESQLQDVHDRCRDRQLRGLAIALKGEVRGVFAAAYKPRPEVIVLDVAPSPALIAREQEAQKLAARQLEHAEEGRQAVEKALVRLAKVSKRL